MRGLNPSLHKQTCCYKGHWLLFRYIPRGFQGFSEILVQRGLQETVVPWKLPSSFCFDSNMTANVCYDVRKNKKKRIIYFFFLLLTFLLWCFSSTVVKAFQSIPLPAFCRCGNWGTEKWLAHSQSRSQWHKMSYPSSPSLRHLVSVLWQ